MNIVIRADASSTVGTGHFMRCLVLASELRLRGANVIWVSKPLPQYCVDLASNQAIQMIFLPDEDLSQEADARETLKCVESLKLHIDWLIVDHYELGIDWERAVKHLKLQLLVFDDFAQNLHDCDFLFSQNYPPLSYDGLIPSTATCCVGPQYTLLRNDFYHYRRYLKPRDGVVRTVLIAFGGTDPSRSTLHCLNFIRARNLSQLRFNVVVGHLNPDKNILREISDAMPNVHFYLQVNYIAKLMSEADLAFGSGGTSSWERCFLGLPAIVNIVADNQKRITDALGDIGALINVGVGNTGFCEAFLNCLQSPDRLQTMSATALKVIPYDHSKTGARRIVDKLYEGRLKGVSV